VEKAARRRRRQSHLLALSEANVPTYHPDVLTG